MRQAIHVRAEFPGNVYDDFTVNGEGVHNFETRTAAEMYIHRMFAPLGPVTRFEWRGAVVFCNRRP